ncbi:MAG: hypothetical protein IPH35_08425 [Rhodoferax sp.]|nr:hypothetical protein [Rhodoferax sp.]
MSIEFKRNRAIFMDFVTVEDAEGLLAWLQSHPKGTLDLSRCEHLHAANLQVLMAARPTIAAWPTDTSLADWLRQALQVE